MNIIINLKQYSNNNKELENFIFQNIDELYTFFQITSNKELFKYKREIKKYLMTSKDIILSLNFSNSLNKDFIFLILEICAKLNLFMEFNLFYTFLLKNGYKVDYKLQVIYQYYKIKNFNNYYEAIPVILELLKRAYLEDEEDIQTLTKVVLYFYLHIIYDFNNISDDKLSQLVNQILDENNKINIRFLDEELLKKAFSSKDYEKIQSFIDSISLQNIITSNNLIKIEDSDYSNNLRNMKDINFDKIRELSKEYILNIGNPDELHYKLNQGIEIIKEQDLLYKYIFDYGKMHKLKLYDSFNKIIPNINNKKINVIDWGCGQALATSLLIDYIKEKKLNIIISDIILIEPSIIALERGLLHIDTLKDYSIKINAINKDLDSLKYNDLIFDNSNVTLHLFSNILDVEFFSLNQDFFNKIVNSQKNTNYFICVSPNINHIRNTRLDIFYNYFKKNHHTELISKSDSNIGKYKRYEIIFKSNI